MYAKSYTKFYEMYFVKCIMYNVFCILMYNVFSTYVAASRIRLRVQNKILNK